MLTSDSRTPVPTGIEIVGTQVTKEFQTEDGPHLALSPTDFTIRPGEFVAVVGPSGCGKSTLMLMAAGLLEPTGGQILVDGVRLSEPLTDVGIVFQDDLLLDFRTARENILLQSKIRGLPRAQQEQRTDELMAQLGVEKARNRYPNQLSGGMRQRMAIARALVHDPAILLMDEPFGALDEQTRFLLQEELLRIWERTGKTVLFVTHSIDEALILADKIVVMSSHPGTIRDVIDVPFARPRFLTDVRSDPVFADLFTTTWSMLREEVETGGAFSTGPA